MKQIKLKKKQQGFVSALISVAGGLLANKLAADAAADANSFSAASSATQMAFQERMSNTAHQREVKDLRKAGLNPILSARYGGATTPTGSSATGVQAKTQDPLTPAIQQYWSAKQTQASVKNTEAQTTNLEIDSRQKEQDIRLGERNIEGKALSNEEVKNKLLYIQPESITQAKQKSIQSKLETAIKATQNNSDKEKLIHLRTRLIEAKSKEKYWKILGANAHLLTSAAKVVGVGAAIAGIWRTLGISAVKKTKDRIKKFKNSDYPRNSFPPRY